MNIVKPILIAEIGCNHQGDIDIAKKMIAVAANCGASFAKFQKRCPKELLTPEQYNAPHPDPNHSYGKTYGKHREFLEFTIKQHIELSKYCKKNKIGYSTSVWDLTSAKQIVKYINPTYIKVPSACNTNTELLRYLRDRYENPVHLSLGMTTKEEEKDIYNIFRNEIKRLVIYSCTSGYPVPFDKVHLLEIDRIKKSNYWQECDTGFSGHHLGFAIDIAAYILGAKYIERHFTLDRTLRGSDHSASLEPKGIADLARNLKATYDSLTYKPIKMENIELEQRQKLKYRPH